MSNAKPSPLNALTVDVEDWVQSVFDNDLRLTDRFVRNTHRVLELFAAHTVRATFFVLGLAAERASQLVREIHAAGHEVQSHGYGHRLVTSRTPQQFREDVTRSKRLLENLIGAEITGYRAPAFSITRQTTWALEVLAECGFRCDSSIVPALSPRYGIADAPRFPHTLALKNGARMIEVPVATLRLGPWAVPIGGGGYFRLYPSGLIHHAVERLNRLGHATAVYLHPYEFAPSELAELHPEELGHRHIPLKMKLHQGLGRRSVPGKLHHLLERFRFSTMHDLIASAGPLPTFELSPGHVRASTVQDIPRREPILS